MPQNFIRPDIDQSFLMPPDVREWLPEGELAWLVRDVVATVDLAPFTTSYRANGAGPGGDPPGHHAGGADLRACGGGPVLPPDRAAVSAGCGVPGAGGEPDPRPRHHRPVRDAPPGGAGGLFAQVLRLCQEAGMVSLGEIAIDGTKIAADVSWSANHTEAALAHQVAEAEAALAKKAADLLGEHEATDLAEDTLFGPGARGDELPVPLRRAGERLARLREAGDRLAAARAAAQDKKVADWQARRDAGRRAGRKPGAEPSASTTRRTGKPPRANTTDPDSRAMRCQHSLIQGYNAQAAVTGNQLIVGAMLSQQSNDQGQLHDVLHATRTQLAAAGLDPAALSTVLADAGYANETDFARAEQDGLTLLAPLAADHYRNLGEDPAAARDLTKYPATARAQDKLRTPQGQEQYAHRGRTVEPVFGQAYDDSPAADSTTAPPIDLRLRRAQHPQTPPPPPDQPLETSPRAPPRECHPHRKASRHRPSRPASLTPRTRPTTFTRQPRSSLKKRPTHPEWA